MITYEYGNPEADTVLIQPTGEHEMASLENEVREIEKRTSKEFRFIATKVENWNDDLSPWKAPAVFKTEDFCGGASKTLENIIALCADKNRKYYIGGYSLAGLFALWVACQTDIFSGVAAASPSVWFPGFIDYMKTCDRFGGLRTVFHVAVAQRLHRLVLEGIAVQVSAEVTAPDATSDSLGTGLEAILARRGA